MSSTQPGKIFNVDDLTEGGASQFETSAVMAQIETNNPVESRQIERNAEREQEAAAQAASVAKMKGSKLTGEPTTAAGEFKESTFGTTGTTTGQVKDQVSRTANQASQAAGQFKDQASRTTDQAVEEGKHDVQEAKATGQGYIDQAKAAVNTVIETAQNYLPTAVGGKPADPATTANQPGIVETVQTTAANAYNTVVDTAQPHIEHAKGVAQGYMGTAGTQGAQIESHNLPTSSTGIPATTAPLESGKHTVASPYPATTTNLGTDIGNTASSRN